MAAIHCYILTLDRCTCVNKRKKKRKQVDVMKEYRQVPEAVESWRQEGQSEGQLADWWLWPSATPGWATQPRCEKNAAMVKRRSLVNIAVCPCLHSSLTHNRNINPLANKVWEIHIFIKKYVRSFIEVRKLFLIMFPLIFVYVYALYTTTYESWTLLNKET